MSYWKGGKLRPLEYTKSRNLDANMLEKSSKWVIKITKSYNWDSIGKSDNNLVAKTFKKQWPGMADEYYKES